MPINPSSVRAVTYVSDINVLLTFLGEGKHYCGPFRGYLTIEAHSERFKVVLSSYSHAPLYIEKYRETGNCYLVSHKGVDAHFVKIKILSIMLRNLSTAVIFKNRKAKITKFLLTFFSNLSWKS